MSHSRKPRGDSRLKTLSPDKQKQLAEQAHGLTLAGLRVWAKTTLGLETSKSALSEFLSWYYLGQEMEEAASFADQLKADLAKLPSLNLDDDALNRAAQVAFELRAAKAKDLRAFVELRKLRQKDTDQKQSAEKIKLELDKYRDEVEARKRAITDALASDTSGGITPATRARIEQELNLL
jgi:hypothetical protein